MNAKEKTMATMQDIEKETREYAKAKRELTEIMTEVKADTEALKARYVARIRKVMGQVTAKHADLYREIAENKNLFSKPRTQEFDGIKVGLKMGKGKLEVADEKQTILAIEEELPEKQAKLLIRTEKSLIRDAVKKLPEETLFRIGAEITGKEDRVVIEDIDSQIDKVLSSLLKFQVEELNAEYQEEAA
jgi:hypothetical protein